jgi:hypothetical protein
MKRLISAGFFTLVSILPAFNAPAEDAGDNPLTNAPTQYSADLVVTRKMGQQVGTPINLKVYVDGNKRRTDQDGGNTVILRGDLNKRYMLTPGSKTYVEGPLDPKMLESSAEWAKRFGIVHEKVGTEEINGELCDKYHFSSDPKKMVDAQNKPAMPPRRNITGFIWVGQKTHMLLKSEDPMSTAEWKNVKLGPPDASVFELPADYKKMERPGLPQMRQALPQLSPAAPKSEEQKSGEQKSGTESPSPSASASPADEKSDQQKPDSDKSSGDKSGD